MYRFTEDIHVEFIDNTVILVDLINGKYFEFNDVASQIVEGIQNNESSDEIVRKIHKKYQTPKKAVQKDVNNFINQLVEKHFVSEM